MRQIYQRMGDWLDPEDQIYEYSTTLSAGKRVRISLVYEKISGFDEVSLANINLITDMEYSSIFSVSWKCE